MTIAHLISIGAIAGLAQLGFGITVVSAEEGGLPHKLHGLHNLHTAAEQICGFVYGHNHVTPDEQNSLKYYCARIQHPVEWLQDQSWWQNNAPQLLQRAEAPGHDKTPGGIGSLGGISSSVLNGPVTKYCSTIVGRLGPIDLFSPPGSSCQVPSPYGGAPLYGIVVSGR